MADHFSLRWNNFHRNMSSGFRTLLMEDTLVDVTLAADGRFVQAHRLVLSVCSPYFKNLFAMTPCSHPIVIMKDVHFKQLTDILSFMYQGEVNVHQEELADFLKTAELLQIRGLAEQNVEEVNTDSLAQVLSQPPCPQHPGLHPPSGPPTKAAEKERAKMHQVVRITSEQRLLSAEGSAATRALADAAPRARAHKLVHRSPPAPLHKMQSHLGKGPTTSVFAGVPVKEELPDVPSDPEQVVDSYEFVPGDCHVANADLRDTPVILQNGESGEPQVMEKDLWTAPPTQGGAKKSSSRNVLNIDKGRGSSIHEQPKITRPRRQRTIALNKIRRFLVTPKRSQRIRKMKRKQGSFFRSSLSSQHVTDVSKQLSASSRNAGSVKSSFGIESSEQGPVHGSVEAKMETSDITTNVNDIHLREDVGTLHESKDVLSKKHLKTQDTKKIIAPIENPKKKMETAGKKKVKHNKGKKRKVNSDPTKKDSTNDNKNKKMCPLKKAKRGAHINKKDSAADHKRSSSMNRKKIIVVIAAKKTKSAVALARKMQSPVRGKPVISSGSPERGSSGATAHLRSSAPHPNSSAKDSSGGLANGQACRHSNCLGCRGGN